MVGGIGPRLSPNHQGGGPEGPGSEKVLERCPEYAGDFRVGFQGRTQSEGEHEGADQNRNGSRRQWGQVVELSYLSPGCEAESHLLGCLPNGGGSKIEIIGVLSPAGEPDLPGPWITDALCPTNKQDGVWPGDQDDRDGGGQPAGSVTLLWRSLREKRGELLLKRAQ
jgi:hypothetical protein